MESIKISVSSSSCVDEPTVQSNMPTSELTDNWGIVRKYIKEIFKNSGNQLSHGYSIIVTSGHQWLRADLIQSPY